MKPKLTVGLLAYNHEKYIEDCFKSILAQSFSDFDIVILNDASEDNTDAIIQEYMGIFRNRSISVHYICHKNNSGNISRNINELINAASGQYFFPLACDDMFYKDALMEMVNILDNNSVCDMAYANMIAVDDDYKYGDPNNGQLLVKNQREGIQERLFERLLYRNCITAPTVIYRTSVFEKYGLHDETIWVEDYEYWLRISQNVKFYFYNKPMVLYRRTNKSTTVFQTDGGKKRLLKMMEADYSVKKKYIKLVSAEYAEVCMKAFYEEYYKTSKQLEYQEGISWLENRMSEDDIFIDDRCFNYEKMAARLGEEGEILATWVKRKSEENFLSKYFDRQGIKSIAIYGYSRLGKLLEEELKNTNVILTCIVDRKGKALQASVPVVSNIKEMPHSDAVIVAPRGIYNSIFEQMQLREEIRTIDIGEVIGKED